MDMSGYTEISPAPEDLQPDDRVVITYPLYQTGEWLMAYQVTELEKRLEEDGRWQLLSWQYDPDAPSIQFTIRVRRKEEIPTEVYLAGFKLPALLGLIATSAIAYIAYDRGKKVSVWRAVQATKDAAIQAIEDDPGLSPEAKERAKQAVMNSVPNPPDEPIGWSQALVWAAVAIVVVAYLGERR